VSSLTAAVDGKLKIGLVEDRQEDGLTTQTGADVRCQKLYE